MDLADMIHKGPLVTLYNILNIIFLNKIVQNYVQYKIDATFCE